MQGGQVPRALDGLELEIALSVWRFVRICGVVSILCSVLRVVRFVLSDV